MHSILKKLEDSITIIFLIHVYTYLVLILIANKTVFDYNKVKLIDVWHIYNTAIFYLRIFFNNHFSFRQHKCGKFLWLHLKYQCNTLPSLWVVLKRMFEYSPINSKLLILEWIFSIQISGHMFNTRMQCFKLYSIV